MDKNTAQTRLLREIRELLAKGALSDELVAHYSVPPSWRVALQRERALEPAVRLDTAFKPLIVNGEQKRCKCHNKPMLCFQSNNTINEICTISAWWQIAHQAIRRGKWRTIPQSPTELYRLACNNGKSK